MMPDIRLIDANAIVEKLKSYYEALSHDVQFELIRRDEVSSCIAELINAPTIDAQPVKHGHWEVKWKKEDYHEMDSGEYAWQYSKSVVHVTCSYCRNDIDSFEWDKSGKNAGGLREMAYKLQFNRIDSMKKPYCPNCGAKMGGDADER